MPPRKYWDSHAGKWKVSPDTSLQDLALKIAQLLAESGAKVADLGRIQHLVIKNLSVAVPQKNALQEPGVERE